MYIIQFPGTGSLYLLLVFSGCENCCPSSLAFPFVHDPEFLLLLYWWYRSSPKHVWQFSVWSIGWTTDNLKTYCVHAECMSVCFHTCMYACGFCVCLCVCTCACTYACFCCLYLSTCIYICICVETAGVGEWVSEWVSEGGWVAGYLRVSEWVSELLQEAWH